MTHWLMLIVALPTRPSSVRVRAWRKLRALGAAALKNSVYLLPYSPERLERLQWLTLEVQKDRGEATLFRVDRIENMSEEEIVGLFQDARNADYKELAERYRKSL
ncbi:MAG TPA: Chromate resistance protein ChrB, partial [Candidatus Binatia bacterium]|nr:Chromate resistance protein ChrB [Candidatus Binatia bacterium]